MTPSVRSSRPRKSLGQHFLHDSRVVQRIVDAAELNADDTLIEIGPGRGALTRRLVRMAGRVIAVELDPDLSEELPHRLDHPSNLECVMGDAREIELYSLVATTFGDAAPRYKVVGNLPYYAASPIIRRTLESKAPPALALFMVQKEVAESMTAKPGSMGLLSVATQFYAEARTVCTVPPSAFRPAPKVRSAVVRLDIRGAPAISVESREEFFKVVRAGFSAPRKQLHNSISHGLGIKSSLGSAILERAAIDGRRRPATLDLAEWGDLYRAWRETEEDRTLGG